MGVHAHLSGGDALELLGISYVGGHNLPTICSSLIGIGWPAVASGLADRAAALAQTTRVASVTGVAVFLSTVGWMLWHRRASVERMIWHQRPQV